MIEIDRERVQLDIHDDGVADVCLNRADKMNALDARMFRALVATGEVLKRSPRVRAVVLRGAGRAFCAGLDTAVFDRLQQGDAANAIGDGLDDLVMRTHGIANTVQHAVLLWRELPVPVIASIHGVAFGGGLQVALGADIRLVTSEARMSVMEVRWGLVPDMAGVLLLSQQLRPDVMRELFYSGRVIQGPEAVAMGLATRVCDDPHASALAMARHIARSSPDAIRAAKRLLNQALSDTPAELLLAESVEQRRLLGSANQLEAVRAGLAQRQPDFSDAPSSE